MTQNPPNVFNPEWEEKHNTRNRILLEISTLENMKAQARTHAAREKLSQQIKDKRRAAHAILTEIHELRASAKAHAHLALQVADREDRLRFEKAFIKVCKANLSSAVFQRLICETNDVLIGHEAKPVTLLGRARSWFKKEA